MAAPETIADGVFQLKKKIGSGGMSEVYLAEVDLDRFDYGLLYAYTEAEGETHTERRQNADRIVKRLSAHELDFKTLRAVLQAKDIPLPEPVVAVKLAKPEADVVRFEAEWRNLLCLNHPHVIKVYGGGLHEKRPYYVMQILHNLVSFKGRDEEDYSLEQKIDVILQAAEGLSYLHENGIIHRDVKPDNIVACEVEAGVFDVKITDLGIAKNLGGDLELTSTSEVIGTPYYMAPEQVESAKSVNHQADIYSLGASLYRFLYKRPPYGDKDSVYQIISSITQGEEPLFDPAGIPPTLFQILRCAMAMEPHRRYPDMADLAADLRLFLEELRTGQTPQQAYQYRELLRRPSQRDSQIMEQIQLLEESEALLTPTAEAFSDAQQKADAQDGDVSPEVSGVSLAWLVGQLILQLSSRVRAAFDEKNQSATEKQRLGLLSAILEALCKENKKDTAWRYLQHAYVEGDSRMRVNVIKNMQRVLGKNEEAGILERMVPDADPRVRVEALRRIGEIKVKASIPTLQRFLYDGDAEVRRTALEALEKYTFQTVVEPLARYYLHEKEETLMQRRLRRQPNVKRLPLLEKLSRSEHPQVRAFAAQQAGEMEHASIPDLLGKLLHDKHPFVRAMAGRASGDVHHRTMRRALIQALTDHNELAQTGIIQGLSACELTAPAVVFLDALRVRKSVITEDMVHMMMKLNAKESVLELMLKDIQGQDEMTRKILYVLLKHAFATRGDQLEEVGRLIVSNDVEERGEGVRRALVAVRERCHTVRTEWKQWRAQPLV